MANILLVDASPLIYSNWNALGKKFSTSDGEPTGLRFGFMRSVASYAKKTKADRVAICYDTAEPVLKAVGRPEYKADRTFTQDKADMYAQVGDLKKMINLTRWAQCEAPGFEADDIVGHLARKYGQADHDVFIVSSDNDLCQLVDPRINIWMPPKKESKNKPWFKDRAWILDHFGVLPIQLLFWRSLWGDKSDNLAPAITVRGSAQSMSAAMEFLLRQESGWEQDLVRWGSMAKALVDHLGAGAHFDVGILASNYEVMRLHDPTSLVVTKGEKNPGELQQLLSKLEIRSLMAQVAFLTGAPEEGLPITDG